MRHFFLVAVLVGVIGTSLSAQSLHYTYWDNVPLAVNPAMAGSFKGTIRATGIHRSQFTWQTWADIGGEYNLPFRPRKKDWITGSLAIAQDVSGSLSYTYQEFRLAGTYHLALDKDVTSDLALGIQFVSANASLGNDLMGDDLTRFQLGGGGSDADLAALMGSGGSQGQGGQDPNASWTDYRVGLVYTKRSKEGRTQVGVQVGNILSPRVAFRQGGDDQGSNSADLDVRLGGFFLMDRMINKKVSILPAVFAQFQGPASEIMGRAMVGYNMAQVEQLRLKAGLGYRLGNIGDTAQMVFGADYRDWIFGLAFDVITSDRATGGQALGAVELSAVKNFIIRKKPKVKPVIFCPRI